MDAKDWFALAADGVVLLHLAYVLFVVLGLGLTLLGLVLRWHWVRNFWFRAAHLCMIVIVVFEAWMGWVCPLTTLEHHLRVKAGQTVDEVSFVGRLARDLLFFQGEPWVFTLCYSLFGVAVALTFVFGCPRWPWKAMASKSG